MTKPPYTKRKRYGKHFDTWEAAVRRVCNHQAAELLATCQKKGTEGAGYYLDAAENAIYERLMKMFNNFLEEMREDHPDYDGTGDIICMMAFVHVPWREGLPEEWSDILTMGDEMVLNGPAPFNRIGLDLRIDTSKDFDPPPFGNLVYPDDDEHRLH